MLREARYAQDFDRFGFGARGGRFCGRSWRGDPLELDAAGSARRHESEAFAYLKYTLFAEQARKNGNETLAGILDHVAADEFEKHFKEHAKLYGLVKGDHENLVNAMSAEFTEATQLYGDMAKRAEAAGDAAAAKHFNELARDELDHRDIFKAAISVPKRGGE